MNNVERRDAEMLYMFDRDTAAQMKQARLLLNTLNKADYTDYDTIRRTVAQLLGGSDDTTMINPPFYCDYGKNIFVGKNFFANYNCKFMDGGRITFGDDVLVGPDCTFVTAVHPVDPERRKAGYQIFKPITVGNNVWFGAGVLVCPGVTIGDNCVIGNSTELKNVILFDNVQVPHYNYVGDSILGYKAHMGAGSITSNVKADKKNVMVHAEDGDIETGCRKFGAMLGDFAEIGCGSVLNPGTVIGKHSNVYPLSSVRSCVDAYSIYKKQGEVAQKYD